MKKQYRKEIRAALSMDDEALVKSVKHYILKHPGSNHHTMMWHGRMKGLRLCGFHCSVVPKSQTAKMELHLAKAVKVLLERGEIAEGEAPTGRYGHKPDSTAG